MGIRLFIGVEVSDEIREKLAKQLHALKSISPKSKWVPPENLHVTLVFLGSMPEDQVEAITAALDGATAGHRPHSLRVGSGGAFGGHKRPRVLWADVGGDVDELRAIHADIEEAMTAFGYEKEQRSYHPHVTLARARELHGDAGLAACAEALKTLEWTPMRVHSVALIRSKPGPGGSHYEVLHRAKLGH